MSYLSRCAVPVAVVLLTTSVPRRQFPICERDDTYVGVRQ